MHVAPKTRSSSARLLAAVAVAAGVFAAAPAGAQQAGATGGKVAVVNVNSVRGKIQELADFRAQVQTQQAMIDASKKQHDKQVQDLVDQIRNFKPDSDQFNDALVKLDETRAKYNVSDQLLQAALLRTVNGKQKKLYDEIMAVTAELSKKKGIDLVLVYNDVQVPPGIQEANPEELNKLLGQRTILYVSDKIDLTEEVSAALDAQYKAGGAPAGGGAVAPAGGTKPK
jgi:Skp family chaperone for outer membrane proteins